MGQGWGFTVAAGEGTGVGGSGVGVADGSEGGVPCKGVAGAAGEEVGSVVDAGGSVAADRPPLPALVLPPDVEPAGRGKAATCDSVSLGGAGVAEGFGLAEGDWLATGEGVVVFVLPEWATSFVAATVGDSVPSGRAALPPELV